MNHKRSYHLPMLEHLLERASLTHAHVLYAMSRNLGPIPWDRRAPTAAFNVPSTGDAGARPLTTPVDDVNFLKRTCGSATREDEGASTYDVRKEGGDQEIPQLCVQTVFIFCEKRGERVTKSQNFVDVTYGSPLKMRMTMRWIGEEGEGRRRSTAAAAMLYKAKAALTAADDT